jgi:hypothetical protein
MDKKKKDGYVAGITFLFIFVIMVYFTIATVSTPSTATIMGIFAIFFGGLGFGSLWKPESIGAVVWKFMERSFEDKERSSDSHNKQVQKDSSGVQVMAHDSNVTIYSSEQKENKKNLVGKEMLWKETRVIRPSKSWIYQVDLDEGEYLKGKITASHPIDIYLVTYYNYEKWKKGNSLRSEYSDQDILETEIDYFIPMDSTWCLILENKDSTIPTEVRVHLYEEKEA